MFTVSLYIEGQRVDLYGNETIQITDSIRNIMNPDTFFDAYSQQFSVPASPKNNGIFSHYYNPDVVDGFSGTTRHDAEIRVNGLVYRKGQIKLNSVNVEHGRPASYDIVFYGNMSRIKEQLRNGTLRDLTYLDKYNHTYSGTLVQDGFEIGLNESGGSLSRAASVAAADVIYPFISHTGQYILDSGVTGNIYRLDPDNPSVTTTQLLYTDLKPAVRLSEIIVGIETEYGITFDKTGFLDPSTPWGDLWMWCHGSKGGVIGEGENITNWSFSERTYNDGGGTNTDVTFGVGYFPLAGLSGGAHYDFTLSTTITGTGNYDVRVYDQNGPGIAFQELNVSGSDTFNFTLYPNTGFDYFRPRVEITSAGTITVIDISLSATRDLILGTDLTGVYDYPSKNPVTEVNISLNMPDMTILDFLIGIFKMFNLVIYADSDGVYYVETMDDYYASGTTRDITAYVDDTRRTVFPPTPYDDIIFKFEESDSFLLSERRDRVGESYGDETYSLGAMYEDNDFEVEVPFEKILFERMTDIDDDSLQTNMWAWSADRDGNPYLGAPIIFHCDSAIPSDILPITWEFDGSVTQNVTGGGVNYLFCSNTVNDGVDWTLTFGSELGEYTLQTESADLFTNYWENYVVGVYDSRARRIQITAWLPASFVHQYSLADTIVYRNKEYFINSMDINVRTGEAKMELITKWL